MAERVAKEVVEDIDDDDQKFVIDRLGTISFKAAESENSDPFSVPAEQAKGLAGTGTVLKRKVSNELKKFNRSADGKTSSNRIEEEAYTGYDVFGVVTPPYNLDYLAKLYEISSPHYSAVNAKVANIVGLGFKLVETGKTKRTFEAISEEAKRKKARVKLANHHEELVELLEDFNEEDNFVEVLVKVWRDYEATGNGYLEVGRKRDGTIGYVGHIPSQTMRVRRDRDGFVQVVGHRVQYFANFGATKTSPVRNPVASEVQSRPNEVIHIKKYSPTNTYYGIPDIIAAKQAVAGNEFASRFNIDYFENKAVPRHLIIVKGAKFGPTAQSDLVKFFQTNLKGENHRSLIIPLPADQGENKVDFKIEAIEANVQDSSFNNYRKANVADILMAHRVPITKVSTAEGVNLAVARDADKTFKEQVCGPEQRMFEKKINRILREFTDAFEFKLNEMTLTDADTQSKIDERMVKNGIWLPNEVRTRDGHGTIPGGDKRVDLNAKSSQVRAEASTTRQRDADRSAGGTDSNGEGRNPKGEGRTTS